MATDDDTVEAPIATSVQVFDCGECVHPHIVLFDAEHKPIAQAALPDETLSVLAGWWRKGRT